VTVQAGASGKLTDLIWAWTGRTIRARYQQSALGWLWALIQPVATVAMFAIVFTRFVPIDTGGVPYVLFSYAAVVPWTLLATALPDMSMSLVNNMNLVTKIYFPREALPIAALMARLADFGIAAVLLVALVVYYGMPLSLNCLIYLPMILGIQLALILGLGLGFAALNVFYRDVDPFLRLGIQIGFYASPILYPASVVPERWRALYFLNPIGGVIAGYRDVLIDGKLPGMYLASSAVVASLILVLGYWYFKRVEFQFADIV
jgi:lipopolysaccharide transport system permease protein